MVQRISIAIGGRGRDNDVVNGFVLGTWRGAGLWTSAHAALSGFLWRMLALIFFHH
jgi:hypothetical protein